MKIPFNKMFYSGQEMEYIKDVLEKGQISGDGCYTRYVTSFLENRFNIKKVLMTTSATHALEMAAMLIGLKPGDEVIMPSFTFPSTANAVMLQGAKPVFAEITESTLNIEPKDIENKITHKTKAIIPVHYAGIGCEMDKIMDIARKYNLYVIEDAAQGVNAKYKNKFLGTWGHIGCYSFHATKNYVSGEGGAVAINDLNSDLMEKAEIIRQKGTNRSQFIRGEIDCYSWVNIGSNYVPSDLLMAVLYAQLDQLDYIKFKRKLIYDYYWQHLAPYVKSGIIKRMVTIPQECDSNYHLFYLIFESEKIRDKVIKQLKDKGICAVIHFMPLHSSKMGQKLGYCPEALPLTENTSKCLVRLPMYTNMSEQEMDYVIKSLNIIFKEL